MQVVFGRASRGLDHVAMRNVQLFFLPYGTLNEICEIRAGIRGILKEIDETLQEIKEILTEINETIQGNQ